MVVVVVVVAVITIIVIMIVAVMIAITIHMVVVGGNTMDNSFLYIKTLLLVDDEPDLLKMLSDILKDAGFQKILMAATGKEAVAEAKKGKPDLIILDVMLPDKDGFSLMEQLRSFTDVPIIFLTAKDEAADKLAGLGLGADDYIVKPFEMLEVMVRLEKVLERNGTVQEQIQIGDVIIDTASRTVTKMGMEIYLKPMEYNCLMVFAKNPNKALTRNQILQELWNEEFCGETRTVDAHVGRIRKKLGWQDKIKTIPRIGYRLEVDL